MDYQETPWIPTLPDLLKECNGRLGWTQVQLADALGKDPSEISKIMSGKTARPQDSTLEAIAQVYRQAGLDMTLDRLAAARDAGRGNFPNPWDFPSHWVRLVMRIMAEDQNLQDFFYERWSNDMQRITTLLEQRKRLEE